MNSWQAYTCKKLYESVKKRQRDVNGKDALYFCEGLNGCYQKGITFHMIKTTLGALDHLMMQRRWIDSKLGVY